jgi:hypothetical protein
VVERANVINLNDPRWTVLKGGYRLLYDPRPALEQLRVDTQRAAAWKTLWNELHHQGDVGDASYAAVPFLVRQNRRPSDDRWNLFALVATIELCRDSPRNPWMPDWITDDYNHALNSLAELASSEILHTTESLETRGMLAVLAIQSGLRAHARNLLLYNDEELQVHESEIDKR